MLLVAGAAVLSPAAPAQAAYSDPLTAIADTSGFGLTYVPTNGTNFTDLKAALPDRSVTQVLESANHSMRTCPSGGVGSLPINPIVTTSMCWAAGDYATTAWNPQGITSSGDADDDGAWGANKIILSGWNYYPAGERRNDARVAFIDYNDPANPRYRWVYLVEATAGANFRAAEAHIGGMVWYGDKLFVSGEGGSDVAIRVFSMATGDILQVNDGADTIGRTPNGWAAYGYQYIMPQIGYYRYTSGNCTMANNTGIPCFSSISLDRSTAPDSLVASEYFDDGQGSRLFRYDFGSGFLLEGSASATRRVTANQAYRSGVANAQGVLSYNGRWYVAHSSSTWHGQLWRLTPGATGASKTCSTPGTTSMVLCWALHPQALTYWYSTGMVWSSSEAPNERAIFAVPLSSLP